MNIALVKLLEGKTYAIEEILKSSEIINHYFLTLSVDSNMFKSLLFSFYSIFNRSML